MEIYFYNDPIVVWSESLYGLASQIKLKYFSGFSWLDLGGSSLIQGLSNTKGNSITPAIAVDKNNRVVVVWSEDKNQDRVGDEIYLKIFKR